MIISKNTNLKDLSKVKNGETLEITKEIALDRQYLTMLATRFPDSDITILSGYNRNSPQYSLRNPFFNSEETSLFVDNLNMLRSQFNKDVTFDGMFSTEQTLEAGRQLNSVVEHIKSLRVDGRPLSPLEKFYAAYNYVTQKMYKDIREGEDSMLPRNLINVLTSDKIVCVGFASWLIAILNELDIPCTYQSVIVNDFSTNKPTSHATVCVRLNDPIYDINGIFHSDPTADATHEKKYSVGTNSFNFALLPYHALPKIFSSDFKLDYSLTSLEEILPGQVFECYTPKVLSSLFPEQTQNKTQDIIIADVINQTLETSKAKEHALRFLNFINQDAIDYSYSFKIQEILRVDKFCKELENGKIKQHINSVAVNLISLGLEQYEVDYYIDQYLSSENIENYYKNSNISNNIQKSTDKAVLQTSKLKTLIKNYDINNINMPCDMTTLKSLSTNICRTVVYNLLPGAQPTPINLAEIKTLQKRGYDLDLIIKAIGRFIESEDMFQHYLYHNQHLVAPLQHPEDEFYLENVQPFQILNKPYENYFNLLAQHTKHIKEKDIVRVFENIFIAEGNSPERAQKLAKKALAKTNTSHPLIFE